MSEIQGIYHLGDATPAGEQGRSVMNFDNLISIINIIPFNWLKKTLRFFMLIRSQGHRICSSLYDIYINI